MLCLTLQILCHEYTCVKLESEEHIAERVMSLLVVDSECRWRASGLLHLWSRRFVVNIQIKLSVSHGLKSAIPSAPSTGVSTNNLF